MGLILRLLGGLLLRATPALIYAVLKALGFSVLTFIGVDIALNSALSMIKSNISGLPANAIQMMALMKVDTCISILFGAMAGRITLNQLGGTFKKLKFGK